MIRPVDIIKTVKIKADTSSGYKIINESDFNPKIMKLYKPGKKKNADNRSRTSKS